MAPPHPADVLLVQGAIIRYLETDLDDPQLKQKTKFGICANVAPPNRSEELIRFFFVTSQLQHFSSGTRDNYIVRIPANTYACLPLDSVLDLWQVRKKPLSAFRTLFDQRLLTQHGTLTAEHLSETLVKVQCSDQLTGRDIEAITGRPSLS